MNGVAVLITSVAASILNRSYIECEGAAWRDALKMRRYTLPQFRHSSPSLSFAKLSGEVKVWWMWLGIKNTQLTIVV